MIEHISYNSNRQSLGGNIYKLSAHCGHINFSDQGAFRAIDTTLNFAAGYFEQSSASYHAQLPLRADGWVNFNDRFQGKDNTLSLKPVCNSVLGVQDHDGRGVTYVDAFGFGRHLSLRCGNNSLRKEIIITNKPSSAADLGFDFEIATSKIIQDHSRTPIQPNFTTVKPLLIGDDVTPTKIHLAKAWDAKGRSIPVQLQLFRSAGRAYLRKTIPWSFLQSATYPVITDASATYYSGAGDGEVKNYISGGWTAVRNAATGTSVDYTSTLSRVTSAKYANFLLQRQFLPIDTSALDDTATITAASLNVVPNTTANGDNDGDDFITVVQTSQASTSTLSNADYSTVGTVEGIDTGERKDITSISVGSYLTFNLNSTGIGWVSKTGFTKLGLREGHDFFDTAYVGSSSENSLQIRTSEYTLTSNDPYIDVTFTLPPATTPRYGRSALFLGVGL